MKFKNLIISTFAIISSIIISSCSAQESYPHDAILALSKANHTLSVVDPSSLKVIFTAAVGSDPHEVIASTDGKTAYVSIYGGGSLHEIDVIDLVAQKALTPIETIPLFGPHGLDFVGDNLYFTAEGSKAVCRYNTASGKIDWSMGTGQDRTHMIYVTDDQKHIYTTNVASGTVSILTDTVVQMGPPNAPPHEDWRETIIPVSDGSEGFDVSPDGKQLWTAAAEDGKIWIIDLARKKVAATLDAHANGANRLAFTKDGKLVFISSLRQGDVFVYDAHTQKQVKKISVGHGAAGILMDPNGKRAFVACSPDNYIAIIDLGNLEVTGHLDVGGTPDGMSWAVRK